MQLSIFQGLTGSGAFLPVPFALILGGRMFLCPLKYCFYLLSELRDIRACLIAFIKIVVLDAWTCSFQGFTDNLDLLLEQARGRRWEKCPLTLWGSRRVIVSTRCKLVRSQTLRQAFVKCVVNPLPRKDWEMGVFACSLCAEPRGVCGGRGGGRSKCSRAC